MESEQSLYYSCMHKMTITVCFNFIGANEAKLDLALPDLLYPVLRDDHQLSLPNTRPDHYFGLRFVITTYVIDLYEKNFTCILQM